MSVFSEMFKLFEDLIKKGGYAEKMGIKTETIDFMRKQPFLKKSVATLISSFGNVFSKFTKAAEWVYKNVFKGEITNVINATSWAISGTCVATTCLSKDLDTEEKWTLGLSEAATTALASYTTKTLGKWFSNFSKKTVLPKLQEVNPSLRKTKYYRDWDDTTQTITSTAIFRWGAPVFAAPLAMYVKRRYFDFKKNMSRLDALDSEITKTDYKKADMKTVRNNIIADQKKILKRELDKSMMKPHITKQPVQAQQTLTTLRV